MSILQNISKSNLQFPKGGKIISLVPSQTELLFDLGLSNQIVGVTRFCVHPFAAQKKQIIGGTKKVDFDKILALKPDLILGNKEENERGFMLQLAHKHHVVMSDIFTLEHALGMITEVGELTHTSEKAQQIANEISTEFQNLQQKNQKNNDFTQKTPKKCLYLIWRKPYMAVAKDTFIDDMLEKIGLENALHDQTRYPELSPAQIADYQPDCIFLSNEPFPFKAQHIAELQKICPNAEIKLVDGEFFSWYGSRLRKAPAYFATLI